MEKTVVYVKLELRGFTFVDESQENVFVLFTLLLSLINIIVMFCQNCGSELPGDVKFCVECGAEVARVSVAEKPVTFEKSMASRGAGKSEGTALDLQFQAAQKRNGRNALPSSSRRGKRGQMKQFKQVCDY